MNFLTNRFVIGLASVGVILIGLQLYGDRKFAQGRAQLAAEIAAAAAEKRNETAETIEEIKDEIENTPDDSLLDVIIDNGWLLPEVD